MRWHAIWHLVPTQIQNLNFDSICCMPHWSRVSMTKRLWPSVEHTPLDNNNWMGGAWHINLLHLFYTAKRCGAHSILFLYCQTVWCSFVSFLYCQTVWCSFVSFLYCQTVWCSFVSFYTAKRCGACYFNEPMLNEIACLLACSSNTDWIQKLGSKICMPPVFRVLMTEILALSGAHSHWQ